MQPIFAEKPRVCIGVVSVSMGLKREEYSLVTHGHPIFPRHGKTVFVQVFPNSPIKKYRSKKPSTEIVLKKEWRENPHNTFDSGTNSGQIFEENIAKG